VDLEPVEEEYTPITRPERPTTTGPPERAYVDPNDAIRT